MQTPSLLLILFDREACSVESSLAALVEQQGILCETLSLRTERQKIIHHLKTSIYSLAVSRATLVVMMEDRDTGKRLFDKATSVFVYGFQTPTISDNTLELVSEGELQTVHEIDENNHPFEITREEPLITRQLGGIRLGSADRSRDFVFQKKASAAGFMQPLISIAGSPHFGVIRRKEHDLYLLATSAIADVLQPLVNEDHLCHQYTRLIAPLLFIRASFGERCWHARRFHANFIVDDPPLKKRYGFFSYSEFNKALRESSSAGTVAFIPWNWKRIHPGTTALLREQGAVLNICIHGCDHTRGEFGSEDRGWMQAIVKRAEERMNGMQQRSGLDYDKVMVFPQGIFSITSLACLKDNSFLAAVNTTPVPTGHAEPPLLRDALDPAIVKYHCFPIFLRQYSRDGIARCAIDAFLGKPLLFGEHHDYFRKGYDVFKRFIARIGSQIPDITWENLRRVLEHTCLFRVDSTGLTHVKIFVDSTYIENSSNETLPVLVHKREESAATVSGVFVNGNSVPYEHAGGYILVRFELAPRCETFLRIIHTPLSPAVPSRISPWFDLRAATRRRLCEVRDNHIHTNKILNYFLQRGA
ncbi:MAG: hypothetical protein JW913_12175 [Chitinispirillaceae bacterium]|nr:hypothetical protein [Chitinispirillaceae bacterium]